jgi:NADH-quinone oxidoreductase subunit L
MEKFAPLIFLLPLLGFLINTVFGKSLGKNIVGILSSALIFIPFVITLLIFINFLGGDGEPYRAILMEWFSVGTLNINYSIQLDQLSLLMMLVVTGIGFLIHVYSIGYMYDDAGFHRFFSYLNLFIFFMLMLVMGSNYLMLFIGWEGVGLCSYLLIGFWYKNNEYNKAATKAFVMNRIGDLALLLGIFLLFMRFNTLEYVHVARQAAEISINDPLIITATILLFVGAIGKSAQIPLFTWLPDAMAGPTPVSALIHAATMVTAGVYLVIRSNVLYTIAPATQSIILAVGLFTAIFAATIGLKQNDIKKVLAYSTVSQLGYMFFALGLGAYTAAFFHLFTHAFFKALLFLGSGSVIHAMGGEQDMRKMGGLKAKLPVTYYTFLIGTIAIAGIPPLAGFFSKDQILASAFANNPIFWIVGVAGALLTAFYMFRLLYLTFHGNFRGTAEQKEHLHESPVSMTFPLVFLAVGSALVGLINIPEVFMHGANRLDAFFEPLLRRSLQIAEINGLTHEHLSHTFEYILMGASVFAVVLVILYTRFKYVKGEHVPAEDESESSFFTRLIANKYYVDELYEKLITNPVDKISAFFHKQVDTDFIDGIVNRTGSFMLNSGRMLRFIQTGNVGFYIFMMIIGIIAILAYNSFM